MNNRNHQKQEKHFIVDILFVLALFGVFAVSALALVTIGADVYQHTVEDMGVNYESRTAVSYIMEKVRQNDTADSIFLTDLENVPALCMLSEIDEETYCTYLYLYDGHFKRTFMRKELLSADRYCLPVRILWTCRSSPYPMRRTI